MQVERADIDRPGFIALMEGRRLADARAPRHARASIEAGATYDFAPARQLYADAGFVPCAPFADHRDDPASCYTSRAP